MAVWRRHSRWLGFVVVMLSVAVSGPSWASTTPSTQKPHHVRNRHHAAVTPVVRAAPLRGALIEDADTGQILYAMNADMPWPPASMAKMMLLLVASEQIRLGRFSVNDPVVVSPIAAGTGGTRLGLRVGQVYPLGELMKAALVKSANDAAVAVGEKIGGSVEGCVRLMNQRARSLGMTHTLYQTVDGLPPRPAHDVDVTDAYDLALVARAIIRETNLLLWSGQEQCIFDHGEAVLRNTNHLIGHFEGCDGLKTGFTYHAGFNLTATAKRGDLRLIAVVLGAPSNPERFSQAARLLQWGFDHYQKVVVLRRGEPLPVHVQLESGGLLQPVSASDVKLLVTKDGLGDRVRLEYDLPASTSVPVVSGSRLGQVVVLRGNTPVTQVDAIAPVTVGSGDRVLNAASSSAIGAYPDTPADANSRLGK